MFSNLNFFQLQKKRIISHYSHDRLLMLQATILSNIFLGCAAIVLIFSAGIKITFPELMDEKSREIFLVLDITLSSICLIAYGFVQTGYYKFGREVFTLAAFLSTFAGLFLTGGFPGSSVVPCLIILPVIGYLFYGAKFGFASAAVVLVVIFMQWIAVENLGLVVPDFTSKASPATNAVIVFAMSFGAIVAIVSIYQSRNNHLQRELNEERKNLSKLVSQDALTGIANSRKFHDELQKLGKECSSADERFSIIFLDLDDFKNINDSHGHYAGDCVLKVIASRIGKCVRETDLVARIGGDEFGVLLKPEIDTLFIDQVKIKLQKTLREPITVDCTQHHVGVSVGHSVYPDDATDLNELLKLADQSMYETKTRKSAASDKTVQLAKAKHGTRNSIKAA